MPDHKEGRESGEVGLIELAQHGAADLRLLADTIEASLSMGSPHLGRFMSLLFDLDEDLRMITSEVEEHLVIAEGAASGLFSDYPDRIGLNIRMALFSLRTVADALADSGLALDPKSPRSRPKCRARSPVFLEKGEPDRPCGRQSDLLSGSGTNSPGDAQARVLVTRLLFQTRNHSVRKTQYRRECDTRRPQQPRSKPRSLLRRPEQITSAGHGAP
jgi:hypothetical protein